MELFAGLIEQDLGASSQWISHLRAGIRRLSGTVNNVLSLNDESKSRLAPVDLAACVQSGLVFVQPIAEQAGLQLSFFAADDTPSIQGNEDAIHQIVLNIVVNAIRHTDTGGRVARFDAASGTRRIRPSPWSRLKTPAAASPRASSPTSSMPDSAPMAKRLASDSPYPSASWPSTAERFASPAASTKEVRFSWSFQPYDE